MVCISRVDFSDCQIHIIQIIKLDQSSHRGYEGRHAALHAMGRHGEAFQAFRMMMLKLEQSPDPRIRGKLLDLMGLVKSFD